jgi:hypothetical protein
MYLEITSINIGHIFCEQPKHFILRESSVTVTFHENFRVKLLLYLFLGKN